MEKANLAKINLPDSPGVYFFLGKNKEILYIGKATSLKNRVYSYFVLDIEEKRSILIKKMVSDAKTIEFTVTESVIEALILESNLIRTHKPHYNTRSKDDKSYNHLIITNEIWPRVLIVRGKDISEKFSKNDIKYHFGPFTSGSLFKEALKIVRRLFKFYDTKIPVGKEKSKMAKGKIDFNRQIGLYPEIGELEEYKKTIHQVKLFFQGKKHKIITELEKEMHILAKREKFEQANLIKRKIFALKHIEDTSLLKNEYRNYNNEDKTRVEAYDISHHMGQDIVGVMTVVESGEVIKSEYRKFKIKTITDANDTAALKELLIRRLAHTEWNLPQIIAVDGGLAQKRVAESVLKNNQLMIPVVAVVKDERHKVARIIALEKIKTKFEFDILLANAESHRFAISFHRKLSRKRRVHKDL